MNHSDFELARMIATNSRDIPDMMERLLDEIDTLHEAATPKEGLEGITGGDVYHGLAMRTAAPATVFYEDNVPFDEVLRALVNFANASRVLNSIKSALFYDKHKPSEPLSLFDIISTKGAVELPLNTIPLLIHAITGIGSEAGELVESAVMLLTGHATDEHRANINRESGDIDWFQELLSVVTAQTVDQNRRENIERLQKRFPDKFSEVDAIARADEAGFDSMRHPGDSV